MRFAVRDLLRACIQNVFLPISCTYCKFIYPSCQPVNTIMIEIIDWEDILPIWQNHLWPNRKTPIEPVSAMCYLGNYDMDNMLTEPTFFGYYKKGLLVGVNSGHSCPRSNSYRSRGLWVHPQHRKQSIGKTLLAVTVAEAFNSGHDMIWSYPRKTSWSTYQAAGFSLGSEWQPSETSELNAYCFIRQN